MCVSKKFEVRRAARSIVAKSSTCDYKHTEKKECQITPGKIPGVNYLNSKTIF